MWGPKFKPQYQREREREREARYQWLTPVIPATQEAEIRRIKVWSQPGQIVRKTLSRKNPSQKKGWWSGSRWQPLIQTAALQKKKKKKKEKERDAQTLRLEVQASGEK
jgi:hypothetical protein